MHTPTIKPLIPPVPVEKIEAELTDDKFIRCTNYNKNKIYIVSHHDSPNVMLEIGRLREITFREAGGGTGDEVDIDEADTHETPFQQIIVWNPEEKEIVGGYRFFDSNKNHPFDKNGNCLLSTATLFDFSDKFIKEYLPHTIELGRSFVHPNYQAKNATRKSLFALDNLWDGLAALIIRNPEIKYLFGKVTMYTTYNVRARDILLHFLKTQFKSKDTLVTPKFPIEQVVPQEELDLLFTKPTYSENYKVLNSKIRELGETIPPLINSYMNISSTMQTFGTSINDHFGGVEETGILITVGDIFDSKKERHMNTFDRDSK